MYLEEKIVQYLISDTLRESVCRICLKEDLSLHNIHETFLLENNKSRTLLEILSSLFSVEIFQDDSMPVNICQECFDKVIIFLDFLKQFTASDSILKNCIACLHQEIQKEQKNESTNIQQNCDVKEKVAHESDDEKKEVFEGIVKKITYKCGQEQHETKIVYDNLNSDEVNSKLNSWNDKDVLAFILKENIKCEPLNIEYVKSDVLKDETDDTEEKIDSLDARQTFGDRVDANRIVIRRNKAMIQCTMCDSLFSTRSSLKLHNKTHSENDRHFCKICGRSYRKLSILKRHIVTHTKNKSFICPTCGKAFHHRNGLKTHMVYHQEKKYMCTICSNTFHFRYLLIEHFRNHHPGVMVNFNDEKLFLSKSDAAKRESKNVFDCTMCKSSFTTKTDCVEHKLTHPKGTKHVCRICDKAYIILGNLQKHMVRHSGKKIHLCSVCGKCFYHLNVLKNHMIYHGEKKFKCTACEKIFHTRHILDEHVRLSHSKNRYNYICETCGKLCSSHYRLVVHKASHTYMCCSYCGRNYKNYRYFKEHLKKHAGKSFNKRIFICDYCGESRNLKTLLELHILSKHLKERRYTCGICNKGFFSKGSLNEHHVVHTRERPEQCNICQKRLINKKALILHYRLHSGEKPYPCNICGEKFLSSSRRLVHFKSKHSEREESCHLCPAKFHLKNDLNKHVQGHLKEHGKRQKAPLFGMQSF